MSDLYQVTFQQVTDTNVRLEIRAVNHDGQLLPDHPTFYLSLLAALYLVAITGNEYAPVLTCVETFPGLAPEGDPTLDHPLWTGILDAHPPTLRQISGPDCPLDVELGPERRNESDCLEGTVLLRSSMPGLFAHLVPGIVQRVTHGEDSPLCLMVSDATMPRTAEADRAPADPRLSYQLLRAVDQKRIEDAVALLDRGANANAGVGKTALHVAARQGPVELVQLLLARGADVQRRDFSGRTPLHHAAGCGHEEIARALLAAGAQPHQPDDEGQTPLDLAPPALISLLMAPVSR